MQIILIVVLAFFSALGAVIVDRTWVRESPAAVEAKNLRAELADIQQKLDDIDQQERDLLKAEEFYQDAKEGLKARISELEKLSPGAE